MRHNQFKDYWQIASDIIAKEGTTDAIELCRQVCKETGQHFNEQETTNVLEMLATIGFMKRTHHHIDGHMIYTYILKDEMN